MNGLPMRCTRCGTEFAAQSWGAIDARNVQFTGNVEGCIRPDCNGRAVQIEEDVTFDIDERGIWTRLSEALAPPDAVRQDYADLNQLLQTAKDLGTNQETLAAAIEQKVPRLRGVGRIIREYRGDVYFIVALLMSILFWLYPLPAETPDDAPPAESRAATPEQVQQAIEHALEEHDRRQAERAQEPHKDDDGRLGHR